MKTFKFIFIFTVAGLLVISDEAWVGIPSPCLCQEFRCGLPTANTSICLKASRVCDGIPDCPMKEDEICLPKSKCKHLVWKYKRLDHLILRSLKEEFKCKFGGCIKIEQVCDGKIDCLGAVDEATDFCKWVHDDVDVDEGNNGNAASASAANEKLQEK